MNEIEIAKIERIIGYIFDDKSLLITAFTHVSYSNEFGGENNEKLEFLGDSVLNFIVAEKLFHMQFDEGEMTLHRSALVSREPLKDAVIKLGLLKYYRLGRGITVDSLSTKFKSNLFEAIIAAIYLDSGLKECGKFILSNLAVDEINCDFKTQLQEILQSVRKTATYKSEQISINPPKFKATVYVDGKMLADGEGRKKRDAEKAAAKEALGLKEIIKYKKKSR